MNIHEYRYSKYAIVNEMLETCKVIEQFNPSRSKPVADALRRKKKLFLAGEGSSRIFPAKNAIYVTRQGGIDIEVATDGCRQACEYNLDGFVVVAASNSGRTRETIALLNLLRERGCDDIFSISAREDTPVIKLAKAGFKLECGEENAIAATKSAVEQALFHHSIIDNISGGLLLSNLPKLPLLFRQTLENVIDKSIVSMLADADHIYFAGRNNGVAEELALKANEIIRKKSAYFEGTYVLHGVEEVLDKRDAVVIIEPFEEELQKYHEVLLKGVGAKVVTISHKRMNFPTILIPRLDGLNTYIQMAAGWSLLVETGIALDIDLDKPVRARKIGNEI